MRTHIAILAALEWWRASGERSAVRLDNLVAHFATVNGIEDTQRVHDMQKDARRVAEVDTVPRGY